MSPDPLPTEDRGVAVPQVHVNGFRVHAFESVESMLEQLRPPTILVLLARGKL